MSKRAELVLYAVVRAILLTFSKLFWRVRFEGAEHLPKEGAFVLAPVHRSNVDTPILSGITRRRLHYMGKDSMWKVKWIGRLFTALGSYPVHRGAPDREAMRQTTSILEQGEAVVIFPEGTRQSGPLVQPLFEGAAYVAIRAGCPIVPVGIGGTEQAMPKGSKMLRPVRVHIVAGEPILPPALPEGSARAPRRVVHEVTEELHARLQELFDTAQARAAAR